MRAATFLYTGTSRGGIKCNKCKKEIKVGKNYRFAIIRVKGELKRYRFHKKCV
jgi:hypothetical protein